MLRSVDRAGFGVALMGRLRAAGADVGLGGVAALTDALDVVTPLDATRLYWVARLCLVHRHADLAIFDEVFRAVFSDSVAGTDPQARRQGVTPAPPADSYGRVSSRASVPEQGKGAPWLTRPSMRTDEDELDEGEGEQVLLPELMPDRLAGSADTPFDQLDDERLADLQEWLTRALTRWPTRRSRRFALDDHGSRVAMRATLARSRRTGWEAVDLAHARRVMRPRRVTMLCDVSRSMQGYTDAYVHFMRAAATVADAEVFVFATRLTRLTHALRLESPEAAIRAATREVDDRFGGTRIAGSLTQLLRSRHGESLRGGIVLVASDGWDSDEPADLARAMARLRRRAHTVIWLNPRSAAPGYTPTAAGMAAALPFCDAFLPAHTPRAMADVFAAVVNSTASRGRQGGNARPSPRLP